MNKDYKTIRSFWAKSVAYLLLAPGLCLGGSAFAQSNGMKTVRQNPPSGTAVAQKGKDSPWAKGGLFEGFKPEQEIRSQRSRNSKHFQNADGSVTVQIGRKLHYRDERGNWLDINPSIISANGVFHNLTNDIKSYFPATSGSEGVRMVLENRTRFDWWQNPGLAFVNNGQLIKNLPARQATGSTHNGTLRYTNLYPGISEEFTIRENGMESSSIIHALDAEMAALPAGTELRFSQFIPLQAGWQVMANGSVQTGDFDAAGFSVRAGATENIHFGQVTVFDNAISKKEALLVHLPAEKLGAAQKAKLNQSVLTLNYRVRFVQGGIEVWTRVPAAWLQASDRAFPVTVDPTVTVTPVDPTDEYLGPLTYLFGYQRYADLYEQSEIGAFGNITKIEFNCVEDSDPGNVPVKVYLRTTAAGTLTGTDNWNSTTYTGAGATLSLDGTLNDDGSAGWKSLDLTNPFPYTQDNLLVMVKDAWGGSGSGRAFSVSGDASYAGRMAYNLEDGTDPGDAVEMEVDDYLPEIRITYTALTACTGTPTLGNATSSQPNVCPGVTFTLGLSSLPNQSGINYQWQSSTNGGTTWTNLGSTSIAPGTSTGQTQATSYRLIATCTAGGLSDTSTTVAVGMTPTLNCYCTPPNSNCTDGDLLLNVTFAGINNNSDCGANGYNDYTALTPANVLAGGTYPISVTVGGGGGESVAAWIDYNQNGVFEASEYTYLGNINDGVLNEDINIPVTALAGNTRMRVRLAYQTEDDIPPIIFDDFADPSCDNLGTYGETEDYIVTITAATNCAGAPNVGTATSSVTSVCPSVPFTLNVTGNTLAAGISYQWQASTNGGSTWTNLGSAQTGTGYSVSAGITQNTQYRLIGTCSNGGQQDTTAAITVTLNPVSACYCTNAIPFNCTDGDLITNVTFGSINNNSACANTTSGYSDYTATVAPATVPRGTAVPISVTVGPSGAGWLYESVGVWIDYNQNGVLDSLEGEYTNVGTGLDEALTANINIPATALPGTTRMRVVVSASRNMMNHFSCGPIDPDANFGEMEDYLVTILAPGAIDSVVVTTQGNVPAVIGTPTGTLQLVATVYPTSMPQGVTWSIRNVTGTATINTSGLVTASAFGTVWGKAVSTADPAKSDSILINIQPIVVDSVVVTTQGNVPAIIGSPTGTLQLVAAVYPLTVSQAVTWSIRNVTGTATINTSGLVTASAAGTVWGKAVSVADPTKSDSILITITPTVDSVVVATQGNVPAVISTPAGTLQLVATVYPTSLSQAVTWSIRNTTGAATISSAGLVTAQSNGFVWAKARSVVNPLMADSILIAITQQNAGIDEASAAFGLELFPNPGKDLVTLRSSAQHGRLDLQVTDLAGRIVYTRTVQPGELNAGVTVDVTILPSGVYVFRLRGDDIHIDRKVIRQ